MGLLDDLKKQAEIVRTHEDVRRTVHTENVQVVEDAMRRSFAHLHDVLEQLKVIKPTNRIVYRLPGIAELSDLDLALTPQNQTAKVSCRRSAWTPPISIRPIP